MDLRKHFIHEICSNKIGNGTEAPSRKGAGKKIIGEETEKLNILLIISSL